MSINGTRCKVTNRFGGFEFVDELVEDDFTLLFDFGCVPRRDFSK